MPNPLSRILATTAAASLMVLGGLGSAAAAQADPLPVDCEVTGPITLTHSDGSPAGWVSKTWNEWGEYVSTTNEADAVTVRAHVGSQQLITAVDGPDAELPYFGGIVGYTTSSNDLGPGSSNYAFTGGTDTTAPGSPAVAGANSFNNANPDVIPKDMQSAIWTVGSDLSLSAQWINSDGTEPVTYTVLSDDILALLGDPAAFSGRFGVAPVVSMSIDAATTHCATEIVISPETSMIAAGASQTFAAEALLSDGTPTGDVTASTVFTSNVASDTIVGNIVTATTAGARTITGTYEGLVSTSTLTVTPAATTSIAVAPQSAIVAADSTTPFTVTGEDAYGNEFDATPSTTFTSSIAGDSFAGNVLTATSAGPRTITATLSGLTDTASITVVADPATSIAVAPQTTTVEAGTASEFTATGKDAHDNEFDVTSAATFTSSVAGDTVVGNVVTATTAGQRTITASYNGLSTTATLTVTHAAAATIAITPDSAVASSEATTAFTTTAQDAYANEFDITADTTFTSSVAGDTVVGNVVTATTPGERTITASYNGLTAAASLIVIGVPVTSITLTLSATQVNQGGSITGTVEGFDGEGNSFGNLTESATFTSDKTTDIIDGNKISFPNASVHVITASFGELSSAVSVTVVPTAVPVVPANPTAPAALSNTGLNPVGAAGVALLLLVAGAAALVAYRRTGTN